MANLSTIVNGVMVKVNEHTSSKADLDSPTFTGIATVPTLKATTGILFGTDTAAANTLDDYEEGTWTPVVSFPTMGNAYITVAEGSYVKVGSLVTTFCRITMYGGTTSSGDLSVTGLPFASSADISAQNAFAIYPDRVGQGDNYLFGQTGASSVNLYRKNSGNTGRPVRLTPSDFDPGTTSSIMFEATYRI